MSHSIVRVVIAVALALVPIVYGGDAGREAAEPERPSPIPEAVFIPTPHDVVEKMLELAAVRKGDVVYDLGCGDGRIVIAAAKQYGCRATGFDIDPRRVKQSRENVKANSVETLVSIEQKDIFGLDIHEATVVTVYLASHLNAKLIPQFDKLKPGSRIVSHQFGMPGVKPDKVVHVVSKDDRGRRHTLYLWTTPLRKTE